MKFFQSNMQTGILVLLVVLVGIVCVALFFTNKEVRNVKSGFVKNRHDIQALQNLLSEVGLTASGGEAPDNFIERNDGPPRSQFMGHPGGPPPGMPVGMFPPGAFPPGINPNGVLPNETLPTVHENPNGSSPEPVPANTKSDPATLNLEKPASVIPSEDVEEVNEVNDSSELKPVEAQVEAQVESKQQVSQPASKTAATPNKQVARKANTVVDEESSDEESSEEESSSDED